MRNLSVETPTTVNRSLVEWLQEKAPVRMADYQRAYAWTENHVVAFTSAILRSIAPNSSNPAPSSGSPIDVPDIGLIILEEFPECTVIADGQQRLLTFALLLTEVFGWAAKEDMVPLRIGVSGGIASRTSPLPSVGESSHGSPCPSGPQADPKHP